MREFSLKLIRSGLAFEGPEAIRARFQPSRETALFAAPIAQERLDRNLALSRFDLANGERWTQGVGFPCYASPVRVDVASWNLSFSTPIF